MLLAVPVAATEATFKAIRHLVGPNTLIMDVGSTKRDVVDAARRGLGEQRRRPSCPRTPSPARRSPASSMPTCDLYTGTPGHPDAHRAHAHRRSCRRPSTSGRPWAATCSRCRPRRHDAAFAAVSHLPHLIAFALINGITAQQHGQDYMALAGPGFRDFTRIAASDPKMWRDILIANREELLRQSQALPRSRWSS